MLWIKTTHLQNNVIHLVSTNDTLVTYVNKINQRVYDMPVQQVDPGLIKQLAKVDSTYKMLNDRIKLLDRKHKDLIASMDFILEAKGHVTSTYITNEYYGDSTGVPNEESPIIFKTFHADDGFLSINSTATSLLDEIKHDYTVDFGKASVDLFKGPGRTFDAFLTLDNPNIKLTSQNIKVRRTPRPILTLSAGVLGGVYFTKNAVDVAPGIGVSIGVPIYTIYK